MTRLSEIAAGKVREAIEALPVPQVVKDSITWDVVPAVAPGQFKFMLVLCMPIHGTPDQVLHLQPPAFDPFEDQSAINEMVRGRVHELQADADKHRARSNGHKATPGGIILP